MNYSRFVMDTMRLLCIASVALAALWFPCSLITGCTTVTKTADDGTTTTTKTVNWDTVAAIVKPAFKWPTKAVLDNNPSYATEVAAINASVATIFTGELELESVKTQLAAIAPKLTAAQVNEYAAAVMDAYELYVSLSGNKVIVPTNDKVQLVVRAITDGIAAGIALHNASTAS